LKQKGAVGDVSSAPMLAGRAYRAQFGKDSEKISMIKGASFAALET
jgi:hypothetical protein